MRSIFRSSIAKRLSKLTCSKWAKITKKSADTALRDIQDLINKDILKKEGSKNYELK